LFTQKNLLQLNQITLQKIQEVIHQSLLAKKEAQQEKVIKAIQRITEEVTTLLL